MPDDTQLTPEELDLLQPIYIGPTWIGVDGKPSLTGPWKLPDRTLGWHVARWCTEYLLADDGSPWRFTLEQLRFILWWFAVDDEGRFIYRTGVLQRLKGWGKDPIGAVLCLVEFVGPSRLSHFDPEAPGGCVGKPHSRAWVQIAAVSRDQTRNTLTMFPGLMSKKLIDTYGIKEGNELIRAHRGRCRLEAVTSSYRSLEGGRATFILLNETHHWVVGNQGPKMFETIDGNATKMDGRYLAITNAFLPGEDSTAEKMRLQYDLEQEGRAVDVKMLYDSVEAHPKTPLTPDALRIIVPKIRGDATWLNVEAIIASVQSTVISPARSRRMWLNQIVADADAIYGPDELHDIERDATLAPGDEIVLGFDGSKYEDDTCLVAVRIKDRCSFVLGYWSQPHTWDEKTRGRWQVPADQVDSQVHLAFKMFDVKAFFADVNLWESYIGDWAASFGEQLVVKATPTSVIGWDMRQSLQTVTRAHERFMSAIKERKIFCSDLTLRRHALNARRRINDYGTFFGKESPESPRKIDAYAAWMLAHEALYRYLTNPKSEKKKSGTGYFL